MELQSAIRLRIIDLMKKYNINGNQLALACGISRSTIHKFIKGTTKSLTIETITLISQSFNMTLTDFFNDNIFINVEVKD